MANVKFNSQILINLRKAIQSNVLDGKQQHIAEYLKIRFQETLDKLLLCTEHDALLQYRAEAAALRELYELVGNSKINVLGDYNE